MAYCSFEVITELLKKIEVHSNKQCSLPTVLDRDPVLAASFLTIADSEKNLELCLAMYDSLRKGENKYPIFESCVGWSLTNYKWFMDFTKELLKLVAGEDKTLPPDLMQFSPKGSKKDKKEVVELFPPLNYNKSKHRAEPVKFRSRIKNVIDMYRIKYIAANYTLEDFRGGFPAWYSLGDTIVFENYNMRTNVRTRIVHKGGEFRYFICGASDNWKEIDEVPLEMDHIVSAILFRN